MEWSERDLARFTLSYKVGDNRDGTAQHFEGDNVRSGAASNGYSNANKGLLDYLK